MSPIRKFPLYLAASVSMLGLAGCVYDPYYPPPPSGYVYGAEPGVLYLDYYYYPSADVYFNISTGYYWYLSGTRWVYTRYLPEYIHLHPHDRFKITAPRDRPYHYHDEHIKRYPPRSDYRPDKRFDRDEREHNRRSYQEYREQPSTLKRPPPDSRSQPRSEHEEDRRRYEEYREQPSTLKRPPPDARAEPRSERERSEDRRRYEEHMRQETQQKRSAPEPRSEPRSERERSEERQRHEENVRQQPEQKRSSPDDHAEPRSDGEQYEERQSPRQRDDEDRQGPRSMKRAYPRE